MAKKKTPADEKLENTDLNLFEALEAIDKKDYGWYDRLTPEQQKKFVPFMMIKWVSAIKASSQMQDYYVRSVDHHANKYYLNSDVAKNPKLQWLMLCAASPGLGKQFHQWIPHIRDSVSKLKDDASLSEIKEFYKKIYPKADLSVIEEAAAEFVKQHKRKMELARIYPGMKIDDIEHLNTLITDDDIKQYKKEAGEA